MTTDKRGSSARLLQRQPGLKCYETAWMMLHQFRRAMVNLEREPLRGEVEVDDTWIGGDSGRFAGKPSTERPESCPRHRRSGEAGKSLRACTDGGHSSLQERHSQCVRPTKCGCRLNDLHGRSQELRRFRTNRLQTYSTHSATARRPSQMREIGGAVRGSVHWQSTTMAHWNLSWREPR